MVLPPPGDKRWSKVPTLKVLPLYQPFGFPTRQKHKYCGRWKHCTLTDAMEPGPDLPQDWELVTTDVHPPPLRGLRLRQYNRALLRPPNPVAPRTPTASPRAAGSPNGTPVPSPLDTRQCHPISLAGDGDCSHTYEAF